MTQSNIVLPYQRTSPVHIPQRDLVLGGADCLALEVSIVERDDPSAEALVLTGGIGGPALTMLVFPDYLHRRSWDYGAMPSCPGSVLWSGMGTISPTKAGTFEIHFGTATMARWPRRCTWIIQLDWNSNGDTEMLSWGHLHVRSSFARGSGGAGSALGQLFLLNDALPAVSTDIDDLILIQGPSA